MLEKCAQEIAGSTAEIIGYDVIITDTEGVIIGASNPDRLGSIHHHSLGVIETRRGEAVNEEQASRFEGTLPGVTYPINSMTGKVVGSMAITGKPQNVKPFALIVKKQIEILLRERELHEYATSREESLQTVIHDISRYIPGVSDRKMLIARAREFGFDHASHYIPIAIDLYQFARFARKIRRKCAQDTTETPELLIQKTKNDILNRIRLAFPHPSDLSVMTGNNKYFILHSAGKNPAGKERSINRYTSSSCSQIMEQLVKMNLNAAIGIGSIAGSLDHLAQSCGEAWKAIQLGKKYHQGPGIYNIQDFRVEELLASLQPQMRNRFIHRNVDPFRKHKDWEALRQTFLTWCENNFSLVGAAKALHLHRNTLNYRLEKIRDMGSVDLKDYRQTLKLYLAFRMDRYVGPGLQEDNNSEDMDNLFTRDRS